MIEHRYRAFLCYSHRDSGWADWLHAALENFPIPSRLVGLKTHMGVVPPRLAPVFRDRDELPSATSLSEKVSDAIAQSANLVVICSPHAAQSRWVDEEIRAFQRQGRADRIFCLIVDGEPGASAWAGHEHDECMPAALRHRLDADGRDTGERNEPIAADARPGGDGKTNARLKLIAGLLGVGFDDLMHRDRRRRRTRWLLATGSALALLCLTSVLAVNAVIARHAAERRQKQAEDLIEFMLGDLDDKLRQVNRLDILESVADKAVKYFASMPLADVNDATLLQGARALQKIGRVRFDQARMAEAESAFTTALATTEELVRRAPAEVSYTTVDAETRNWLGRVAWARGDLDGALQRFRAALDELSALPSGHRDESATLELTGTLRTNVGRVLEANGNLDAARAEYLIVLTTYERLSARESDHLEWKSEVGYAHNNLGQVAWKEGHLDEAIREYSADHGIKMNLAALDSGSNERREDLLISEAILGKSLAAVCEGDLAERYMRAAVDESNRLLDLDASVTSWQEDAGYYALLLAALQRGRGNLTEANRLGDAASSRLRALAAQAPENVQWARDLIESEMESARRELAAHREADAAVLIRAADTKFRDTIKDADADPRNTQMLARLEVVSGDVSLANNDPAMARSAWQSADARTRGLPAATHDPRLLDARAGVLLRLGEIDAAKPLLGQLAASGYCDADLLDAVRARSLAYVPDVEARRRISAVVAKLVDPTGTGASGAKDAP